MNIIFEKSFKFILIIVIPLIFTVFMLSNKIIGLVLGSNFSHAVPLLQLLTMVWGFMFFSILCNKTLNASNRQKYATLSTGICLIVNVVLDLILIPQFGYMGAGFSTLVAEISLFIVSFSFVTMHVCKISLGKVVLKPFISSLIAGITGFALGGKYILVIMVISITVYLLMLFVLRVFEDEELDLMKEAFHKIKRKFLKKAFLKT